MSWWSRDCRHAAFAPNLDLTGRAAPTPTIFVDTTVTRVVVEHGKNASQAGTTSARERGPTAAETFRREEDERTSYRHESQQKGRDNEKSHEVCDTAPVEGRRQYSEGLVLCVAHSSAVYGRW